MSFFDSQPTGRLLNRFTKDTEAVDISMSGTVSSALSCFVTAALSIAVVVVVSPATLVAALPLAFMYMRVQKARAPPAGLAAEGRWLSACKNGRLAGVLCDRSSHCLLPCRLPSSLNPNTSPNPNTLLTHPNPQPPQTPTPTTPSEQLYVDASRELKRLDSLAFSPIFQHFTESLTGLATIRAFGKSELFLARNTRNLDHSNRVYWPIQARACTSGLFCVRGVGSRHCRTALPMSAEREGSGSGRCP